MGENPDGGNQPFCVANVNSTETIQICSDIKTCKYKSCWYQTGAHDNFQCNTGNCIPWEWRCDGFVDCAYGEDEVGCRNLEHDHIVFRDPNELNYASFSQCPEDYTYNYARQVKVENGVVEQELITNHVTRNSPCYKSYYYTGFDIDFKIPGNLEELVDRMNKTDSVLMSAVSSVALLKLDYIQLSGERDFLKILRKPRNFTEEVHPSFSRKNFKNNEFELVSDIRPNDIMQFFQGDNKRKIPPTVLYHNDFVYRLVLNVTKTDTGR